MKTKQLKDIKHGERVFGILQNEEFSNFSDLQIASSLDRRTLQLTLSRLRKSGYIRNTDRGWAVVR